MPAPPAPAGVGGYRGRPPGTGGRSGVEWVEDCRDREAAGLMLTLVLAALLRLKAVVLLPLEEGPNLCEAGSAEEDGRGTQENQTEVGRVRAMPRIGGGVEYLQIKILTHTHGANEREIPLKTH